MNRLLHLLGSDIPHHNQTILNFFNSTLAEGAATPTPREFWVVSRDPQLAGRYPALAIQRFETKSALARAVSHRAQDRAQQFFCHGQFNAGLWLALLSGKIRRHQLHWHIWGADFYEESRALKFRLFYLLRRRMQGRVASVWGTLGDLGQYRQRYPQVFTQGLYFPTRMPESVGAQPRNSTLSSPLTILVGNSGDPSNRHLQALAFLQQQFGQQVKLILPMGYPENNQGYISQVRQQAEHLFSSGQVTILEDKLSFDRYVELLGQCDLGYFGFERQQGIGTLSLLIAENIPFILNRNNPFWHDLAAAQLPLLFEGDSLTLSQIQQAKQQLQETDKQQLPFFYPGYIAGWQRMLQQLENGERL